MNTNYISKIFSAAIFSGLVMIALCGLSAIRINAQTVGSADNPTCSDYGLTGSLKIDSPFKASQVGKAPYSLPNTNNGKVSIQVNSSKPQEDEVVTFSFTTVNQAIKLVIVKGQGSNVYTYNSPVFNGGPLNAPGNNKGVSHVVFCYEPSLGPTAATAMIAGRLTIDSGLARKASRFAVSILNATTLETQTVFANRLGYYEFNDLPVGDTYIISVRGKGYEFAPQTISLVEDSVLDMFGSASGRGN